MLTEVESLLVAVVNAEHRRLTQLAETQRATALTAIAKAHGVTGEFAVEPNGVGGWRLVTKGKDAE